MVRQPMVYHTHDVVWRSTLACTGSAGGQEAKTYLTYAHSSDTRKHRNLRHFISIPPEKTDTHFDRIPTDCRNAKHRKTRAFRAG